MITARFADNGFTVEVSKSSGEMPISCVFLLGSRHELELLQHCLDRTVFVLLSNLFYLLSYLLIFY